MMKTFMGPAACCEDVFEAGVACSVQDHVSGLAVHEWKRLHFQHV